MQDYQPPTLTTEWLLGKTNKWEPIYTYHAYIIFSGIPHLTTNLSTAIHVQSSTFGGSNVDAKLLGNHRCQYHGSIISALLLRIQFVYSLFLQYTPNY